MVTDDNTQPGLLTSTGNRNPFSQDVVKFVVRGWEQKFTNPGRHVATAPERPTVAPDICGFSVWNLPHVNFLAP
jgi:hypothetical protein